MSDPALVAIAGPTASGKSSLAIHLAQRFSGEILNCDSLQMFRGFDIGSAKLSPSERQGIPHHFLDILEPDQQFAAGEYMRQAREILAEVSARGRLPIVVGGTGFYLRALIDGLFAGPSRNPNLRQRLSDRAEERGPGYLHRLLKRLDPSAASAIHPNDAPKLIRAIEVCVLARRPVSELFSEGRMALTGYRVVKVGLQPPRAALYERINQRTREMFDGGLIDEVKRILEKAYSPEAPAFRSHGYRQAVDHLQGRISLDEAIYHAQTRTRQYAKRQTTWFRKENDMQWFSGFGSDIEVQAQVSSFVGQRLALTEAPATT